MKGPLQSGGVIFFLSIVFSNRNGWFNPVTESANENSLTPPLRSAGDLELFTEYKFQFLSLTVTREHTFKLGFPET